MFKTLLPAAAILFASAIAVAGPQEFTVVIRNHVFVPAEITVPAGEKIKLIIKNEDPTPEEFESHSLNREKVINGNSTGFVFIGPLKPGKYGFFGEFNEKTAQGAIVAK